MQKSQGPFNTEGLSKVPPIHEGPQEVANIPIVKKTKEAASQVGITQTDTKNSSQLQGSVDTPSFGSEQTSLNTVPKETTIKSMVENVTSNTVGQPVPKVVVKDEQLSPIDNKVQANRGKISKLYVSGFQSSFARFIKRATRFLNLIQLVGGSFNAHTDYDRSFKELGYRKTKIRKT